MRKVLAVASSGGHWQQLMLLMPAIADQRLHLITTTSNLVNSVTFNGDDELDVTKVVNANRKNFLKVTWLAVQVLFYVVKIRPEVIISTGAAPGYFAILFGRCLGAKTIWVDSLANYEQLSLSGQKIKKHCDLVLTQWSHLSENAEYQGRLL